jgi:hypothetical protein
MGFAQGPANYCKTNNPLAKSRRVVMRTCALAAVVLVAIIADAKPDNGGAPKAGKVFDAITPGQIKALVDQGPTMTKINGSNNRQNLIPPGTILLYVTNEKRHGKLQILKYGFNLTIRWVTYDEDGRVFSKRPHAVVKGTWDYDLDYGVEGDKGKSRPDFWWEEVDKTHRFLTAKNGAAFVVYHVKK